jgi:carbon-monoxide dehydrogenase medium subunit
VVSVLRPDSLAEACGLARTHGDDAKFLGGGSALVLLLKMRMIAADVLVGLGDLTDVPGWCTVEGDERGLLIGGGVNLTGVHRSPLVRELAPSLGQAASVVGNVRIRNVATMGGAVAEADYASDLPSVLVCLGASAVVSDGRTSRTVPVGELITDFFTTTLAEDEVVTGVEIPLPPAGTRSTYLKFSSRSAEDRPCVGVAATASWHDDGSVAALNVVLGAVAAVPQRFPDVTGRYVGRTLDDTAMAEIADAYAESVDPIDDIRGTSWYRKEVVRAQVRRSLAAVAGKVG